MNSSTALVTGATSGIGKEICRQLAALGWDVLAGARDVERGEQTASEVAGRLLVLDVTDPVGVAAAAASVPKLDELGPPGCGYVPGRRSDLYLIRWGSSASGPCVSFTQAAYSSQLPSNQVTWESPSNARM